MCWPPWCGSASSFFVNFVQLVALQAADEQGRGFLHKAIVPQRRLVVPARLDA